MHERIRVTNAGSSQIASERKYHSEARLSRGIRFPTLDWTVFSPPTRKIRRKIKKRQRYRDL